MKFFITFFFAMVALGAAAPASSDEEPIDECANWGPLYISGTPCPAKNFYSECNFCFCLEDGMSAGCTLKGCLFPPPGKCD